MNGARLDKSDADNAVTDRSCRAPGAAEAARNKVTAVPRNSESVDSIFGGDRLRTLGEHEDI